MKVVEDLVELPNKKQTTYLREAPDRNHSVGIIAINEKAEILLQREYSYPPNEIMYQLPGGGIEPGEDVAAAANRELSEESGYIGKTILPVGSFYINNRRSDSKQYLVLAKELEKHKTPEDDEEFIENVWFTMDEIKALIRGGEITNNNLLAALHLFETVSELK
jgi:ADP-ribose pyrophosphatase